MADDPEFQELQVRVSELERLVKHQADQLAIYAKNVEKHGESVVSAVETVHERMDATDARMRNLLSDQQKQPSAQPATPLTEAARQAASQGRGAFS